MNKVIIIGIIGAVILSNINVGSISVRRTIEDNYLYTKISKLAETKEWTLMFYCGGDENPPITGSRVLINLLEKYPYISNEKLNILVLLDYADKSYFGQVKPMFGNIAKFEIIEEYDEINMGDYNTLKNFIIRCKQNYSANRYFLQMIGHARSFIGACYDDNITGDTQDETPYYLTMREIRDAIQVTDGVDIFATTGCLMGSTECAYEFRNCTDVYISSEGIYDIKLVPVTILKDLKIFRKYHVLSNYEIAEKIIKEFKIPSLISPYFTLSAIRTDKLNEIRKKIDTFVTLITEDLDNYKENINIAWLKAEHFEPLASLFIMIDIYGFVDLINKKTATKPIVIGENAEIEITDIQLQNKRHIFEEELNVHIDKSTEIIDYKKDLDFETCVNDLKKAIENATIAEIHRFGHKYAHGLSIYFPGNYYPDDPYYTVNYLEFTNDSNWDEFLLEYLDTDFS